MPRAPEPKKDGLRRYGQWGGNPAGIAENTARCVCEVYDPHSRIPHQCMRKRGHGPGGLYCPTHNPERVKKPRPPTMTERRLAEANRASAKYKTALEALRSVAALPPHRLGSATGIAQAALDEIEGRNADAGQA